MNSQRFARSWGRASAARLLKHASVSIPGRRWSPASCGSRSRVWIAGFDLLYTCQDVEFDRGERLHAVPARFGIPAPFRAARVCHALTALALAAVGAVTALGPAYWVGWAVVVGLLVYEHSLVSADDLSPPDVPSSTSTATSA
jgi:4-hydroxybenzoate polyprenyltransferase